MGRLLVTGGAGYVGSHCCRAFAEAGWEVVVFDNLSTGWRDLVRWGALIEGDLSNPEDIERAFDTVKPDAVAHFAGASLVGESVRDPGFYYRSNTFATLGLLEAMRRHGCGKIVFSSTCAIFGETDQPQISEDHAKRPITPYGTSKLMVEQLLSDFSAAHATRSVSLRYFNAAGADRDAMVGERHACETHLIPLAIKGASDPGYTFTVHGDDFETGDGTAVRDYIHVEDLASAHVLALDALSKGAQTTAYNLGTGRGTSVLEVVTAIERATGRHIPKKIGARRPGDPGRLVAASEKIARELGWQPVKSDIDTIVRSALAWHSKASPDTGI